MGKEEVIHSNVLDYVSILTIEGDISTAGYRPVPRKRDAELVTLGPANVSFLDEVRITNNIVDGDFYYRVRFEYKPKTKSRKASRLFRMVCHFIICMAYAAHSFGSYPKSTPCARPTAIAITHRITTFNGGATRAHVGSIKIVLPTAKLSRVLKNS